MSDITTEPQKFNPNMSFPQGSLLDRQQWCTIAYMSIAGDLIVCLGHGGFLRMTVEVSLCPAEREGRGERGEGREKERRLDI